MQLRCTLCQSGINGSFNYNIWGDTTHVRHNDEFANCDYCSRLISDEITDGGFKYDDGRNVCSSCASSAVNDQSRAEALVETARSFLAGKGIRIDDDFDLALVSKKEMSRISTRSGSETLGYSEFTRSTYAFGAIEFEEVKIYALYGMPEYVFQSTVAHELMHLWQYANAPLNNDPQWCEGSCEYASYLYLSYLQEQSAPLVEYLLLAQRNSSDPIYGEGFRLVFEFVQKNGHYTWLDYLRRDRAAPWSAPNGSGRATR